MKSKADRYRLAGKAQIAAGALLAVGAMLFDWAVVPSVSVGVLAGVFIYGGINDLREAKEMAKGSRKRG